MNILITGAAGFIGSSLAESLIEEGCYVTGIDNFDNYYPAEIKRNNLKNLYKSSKFNLYEGDIRDESLLDSIFKNNKIDLVIHLAAKAGVRASILEPSEYISVNINGTVSILEKMKDYNVKKIIFASSSSVYGNSEQEKFSEDLTGLVQISPYAVTKKSAEDFIRNYSLLWGINAVCLRLFTVYGYRQRPDLAISKFTKAILNDEVINLYGDTASYRDYTYIQDVVDAFKAAVYYNDTPFEIINVGSSNPITLNELVYNIENITNKKAKINYLPVQKGDVKRTYADITKAGKLLNYSPKYTFREGLRCFIEKFSGGE